jgi:hypothetical protein
LTIAAHEGILLDATVVAAKGKASADLGVETALLDLKDGTTYRLDAVAARAWGLIQTPRTVREVRDTLLAECDARSASKWLLVYCSKIRN